jgi:hypothetical protein
MAVALKTEQVSDRKVTWDYACERGGIWVQDYGVFEEDGWTF